MIRRENAVSFFKEYLPSEIVSKVDWRTLKISKSSFVENDRERFSDIVYEVAAKGKLLLIYLLMEHQSSVDREMPLRFLGYLADLWKLWWKQNPKAKKLPGIIPVLFYHGKEGWNVSVHFQDLLDEPEFTFEFVPKFKYLLRDFSPMSDEQIRGSIMLRLFLMIAGKIFSPGFPEEFDKIAPLISELARKKTGMEYIETALRYVYNVVDAKDSGTIETKVINALDQDRGKDMTTIAEKFRMEGEIIGKEKGEIKGKIETYQELLDKGILPREFAEQKIGELRKKLEEISEEHLLHQTTDMAK